MEFQRRYRVELGELTRIRVILVGCGGTGSFLALHLARLAYHLKERGSLDLDLTLVDPDTVEPGNLGRQNFCPAELGRPKALCLMERYNRAFGLAIEARVAAIERAALWPAPGERVALAIGCVDNAAARTVLADAVCAQRGRLWWLDGGNHENSGQVLLGNRTNISVPIINPLKFCEALPAPSVQCPELVATPTLPMPTPALRTGAKTGSRRDLSCAELALAGIQGLMVNQAVAGWLSSYVFRLLVARNLDSYATYFDLDSGSARSDYITAPDEATISTEITEAR